MYYRIYARGIETEEIDKDVKGIENAKQALLEWDKTLSEDYAEMGMIDLNTGEVFGWLDVLEMESDINEN